MVSKMARALGAAALLALPTALHAEIKLQVMGNSGKFKLYEAGDDDDAENAKGITITMDALKEVDTAGAEVGKSGNIKHSVNNFASQEFTVDAAVHDVAIGTAKASKVNFIGTIDQVGEIGVETYLVTEAGVAGNGDESWNVSVGDLKWNIVVPSWTFCNPCGAGNNEEFGEFLDLTITIQGLGTASKSSNSDINLGGGASLMLASKVLIDDALEDMPEGYPMTELQGSKIMTTFRFPKFNTDATYDPVISLSDGEMGDAGSALSGDHATAHAGMHSLVMALPLLLVLFRLA